MQETRQGILDYLRTNHQATPGELSRSLQVTAANIRHHLGILQEQGLVEVVGQSVPSGRGRPRQLYALNSSAQANNLAQLTRALLECIAPDQEEILRNVARTLAGESLALHPNPTQRLYQAVQRLNALNYNARWEARLGGPRVMLEHCPYAPILNQHPELCQMDGYLVERLTGLDVQQTARIEQSSTGPKACIFSVRIKSV
ncbi:MAG: helix-turn-helix domain-containing protein [Anaerolineales bacterium]|nr:helix-turn-helix domain-containing protein [Anaerolineales bacterium]